LEPSGSLACDSCHKNPQKSSEDEVPHKVGQKDACKIPSKEHKEEGEMRERGLSNHRGE
jgi:hypothetical protein